MLNRKLCKQWMMVVVVLLLSGCTATKTEYPPQLAQIIAMGNQQPAVNTAEQAISVEQLLQSVRQKDNQSQSQSNGNAWVFVGTDEDNRQLNWHYEPGDILPKQALLSQISGLIADSKWQLKSIAIGKPVAQGPMASMVLAQKRAVRLQLLIPHQVDVQYQPQLGMDKLQLTFKERGR